MKVPISWLKEFIHIAHSPDEIGKILTTSGIEVDSVHTIPLSFQGIVVGKVVEVNKHPDAEKLVIASVSDGVECFQVVCGASNCRTGLKTAFAKIGATLSDSDGQITKIKKTKLRGVESYGMLCSGQELGLSETGEGIIEFPDKYQEGKDLADLYSDAILEISLTPNLNHCASILGIARELSALTAAPIHCPPSSPYEDPLSKIEDEVAVTIDHPESCPRYSCRLIKGVKVAPSPAWLQQRLISVGMRPVNNIVDATNYVLMEYGQPLHAFDYDKLSSGEIIVKLAEAGEQFSTLDHQIRTLSETTLMICDSRKPIAIAGLMGGLAAEVSESTVNVLIESAYFHPASIRKTSKQQGLQTEASKRYERGADPQQTLPSLERVCSLIQELAGGKASTGIIDVKQRSFNPKTITCRLSRINQLLGTQLAFSEVDTILQRLQCRLSYESQHVLHVEVPTYRCDLHSEVDLIEEVARIYGYHNIPKTSARHISSPLLHAPIFLFEREIRSRLINEGLQEFLTCDLINPSSIEKTLSDYIQPDSIVAILNPNSIDQGILRPTLLPGLLELAKYNFDHKNSNISGFELGRIHFKQSGQYKEQSMAAIILAGQDRPHHWDRKPIDTDFYDLKGIVENLLKGLGILHPLFSISHFTCFHPGRQANIQKDSLRIGTIGEIHPAVLREWGISNRLIYAELNLHDLFQLKKPKELMHNLSQFPSSERDWTITLPEGLAIDQVLNAIHSIPSPLLETVLLLDIHHSEKLGPDLKNATFRFVYRDQSRTLSFEEVEAEQARIINGATAKLIQDGRISNLLG